ncbi:uncharacterized protein Z520_09499 [Fonsecaea multimorphosa CBS 102226]|uniref:Uncharacterized protein n=1 Tax=Fonsecaea multimorphosa CBS 102226 TaxID=1442371 RepID=A0A0D2JWC0_9EURO|nr:uncharacterized protein Z520_09499 [Fonsecaea multimorphosa CBS 102226]KIX94809.1 hypothetical protein Z520_09499 [Fonsecaea multimorphosa CBS 102226]OAL20388.1 hypothetical protein AYO22_08882 [Fonsecaea multimorphosa]
MGDDARTIAIETLCDIRLHRSFILPASVLPNGGQDLRITYSDLGYHPDITKRSADGEGGDTDEDPCIVFFIGGLLGGRNTLCRSASIARRLKVRIISMDRPGLGGSTRVPLDQRVAVQVAAVPALLSHLGIRHVTLASHSGGAPYLIATLLAHRGLLHPKRPHIVLLSPWVHPKEGGARLMQITAMLPLQAIGKFPSLARTVNRTFAFSSGLRGGSPSKSATVVAPKTGEIDDQNGSEDSFQKAVLTEMEALAVKYMFAEDIEGSSDDAILFLRKHFHPVIATADAGAALGKDWLDWRTLADAVVEQEKRLNQGTADSENLHIDVLHSEKDIMIRPSGSRHFDDCWASAISQSKITFNSKIIKGVNHDSILDPIQGASETWLKCVAQRWYS